MRPQRISSGARCEGTGPDFSSGKTPRSRRPDPISATVVAPKIQPNTRTIFFGVGGGRGVRALVNFWPSFRLCALYAERFARSSTHSARCLAAGWVNRDAQRSSGGWYLFLAEFRQVLAVVRRGDDSRLRGALPLPDSCVAAKSSTRPPRPESTVVAL
jgi:hypothetical protein